MVSRLGCVGVCYAAWVGISDDLSAYLGAPRNVIYETPVFYTHPH